MKLLSVATILSLSLPSESQRIEMTTTCHIPPVEVGGRTTLTCNFSANVGQLKEDIQIVHHSNDAGTNPILTCLWDTESLDCIVDPLFKFNNTINDKLHLEIPAAKEYLSGNYSCIALNHKQGNFEKCPFIVQEGSTATYQDQSTSGSSKITAMPSAACSKFMIKNTYIHNEVLTAEENTTVNISMSFENNSCVTNINKKVTVDSFDNQRKAYKESCTFVRSKLSCSARVHCSSVQCVCGSSELYFIKTLNRADKTQWRWTRFISNNNTDSVIILFNVTHPSRLTNLTINGYSGMKLLKQNESANIVCEWQNSNPPTTTARLVKNNITLIESYDIDSITYTLPAVRCSDASTIECVTGNKDQLTVLLLVECPPEFVSSSEMQNITGGHMLRIHVPVRSHTTEVKRCEITQLKYSSKNYSEAHILKMLIPQSLDCSTVTAAGKEQCFCSLTGSPPDLTFNLYLMNVTEEYNGVWQARVTNGIGTGQVSLSLQLYGDGDYVQLKSSDNISPNTDVISTVLGTLALVCAMSAVIISCVKVKLRKDHLLQRTSHVYEEVDTQSVLTVCRSNTTNVGSVHCASETPSAPFPIINLGSTSPDPSKDETYSRLQMK